MIIYSVTVQVQRDIAPEWLAYMRGEHIPEVMGAGFFDAFHVQRIIDPTYDQDSVTFNIQYECESLSKYDAYQRQAASALQQKHADAYGAKTTAFRTVLERL